MQVDTREYGVISFGVFEKDRDIELWEAVVMSTLLGLQGGCLGGVFCAVVQILIPLRDRIFNTPMRRLLEAMALSLLCSTISLVLVMQLGQCVNGTLEDFSLKQVRLLVLARVCCCVSPSLARSVLSCQLPPSCLAPRRLNCYHAIPPAHCKKPPAHCWCNASSPHNCNVSSVELPWPSRYVT